MLQLLGVMGTDIPIDALKELAPSYMVCTFSLAWYDLTKWLFDYRMHPKQCSYTHKGNVLDLIRVRVV